MRRTVCPKDCRWDDRTDWPIRSCRPRALWLVRRTEDLLTERPTLAIPRFDPLAAAHRTVDWPSWPDLEREYLQEMIDLFQTRMSTELNRFVRKVTAWGSIGIAWTVIVALY